VYDVLVGINLLREGLDLPEVTLVANLDYFRGAPALQRIVFRVIPDQATRRLELEKGTVDVVQQNGNLFSLPVADIQALKQNKDVKVLEYDSQIVRYVQYNNTDSELMKDKRVRQAVNLAINRTEILQKVYNGTGQGSGHVAAGYGPWVIPPKELKTKWEKYDLPKAKK